MTLLVRGHSLAESMSQYLREEIGAAANLEVHLNTEVVDGGGNGRLSSLTLRHTSSGETVSLPAAALFVLIGAHPRTDWLPAAAGSDRMASSSQGSEPLRQVFRMRPHAGAGLAP